MTMAEPVRAKSDGRPDEVRVMVVDDSAVVRGLISRWLEEIDGIRVVSSQRTGKAALEALALADPDVIVLDIEMPEMDGLTALPLILKAKPSVAVVMASTLTRRNAEITLKAMALGARECVAKPEGTSGLISKEEFRRDLAEKVLALGNRHAGRRPAAPSTATAKPAPPQPLVLRSASRVTPRVLVFGSSTGGPPALTTVMKSLGAAAKRLPILIAQHMPPTFTAIMADHLARACGLPAAEAQNGETVVPGRIYVAPGGYHMRIEGTAAPVVRLDDSPPINFCRPAVDPLFESAARVYQAGTLAAILTGMGQDGRQGASAIADAGGTVIAQNEESSVVWGMPGAAARAGVCSAIVPLDNIGRELAEHITGARS